MSIKNYLKGKFEETLTNFAFMINLDKNIYTLHKNITLEINGDTTQIDHIIVSKYGIFVIETKNYQGWIYGDEKSKIWTQVIYKKKSKFQNPIHQNYKHIKFLQKILTIIETMELKEDDFKSIIFFANENCEIKTKMPENVISKTGLTEYIKKHKTQKLNEIRVKIINKRLKEKKLKASIKTDMQHIQNIKNRINK